MTVQGEVRLDSWIAADPNTVWRLLVEWQRQGEWLPFTHVTHVDGPQLGVGTRISARTGLGPLGFTDTMTVTALAASRRYEVLHTGRTVRGVGSFGVEPEGAGACFVWWERVDVPGGPLAPLLWRVGRPLLTAGFGWAVRRLRTRAEVEAPR